ncbi:class I SAM-dependent methyltransferase [Hyphomicrobium sp. B1]|uniref:class I SAM-dependent methyltransferase n=1 Tax=unclassified Hyphomicrobium TaxID=2619925 RepID=UPI000213EF58|nr:class I SAM-dependent methyltransferase [Hyphomicrobium sp. MC1]CCB64182.1 putative phosphatidylethanolamine-N-methyltransferase (pmtA) [Hyphomicrobium sp. MC1]
MSDNKPSSFRSATARSEAQKGRSATKVLQLDEGQVRDAYRRWAPVYDYTFGAVSTAGRRHAVEIINSGSGRVLEVGVGTGLSLPNYKKHLDIVGIDLAPEMLEKARERVKAEKLTNVSGLHEMDASNLTFPDNTFDTTVAMYVITVVPDPKKVMLELARVTKPGGEVMLVNHFSQDEGVRGWVERQMAPFADLVGWHSVFDVSRVMVCPDLKLMDRKALRPWGIFTMMRFRKDEGSASLRPEAAE